MRLTKNSIDKMFSFALLSWKNSRKISRSDAEQNISKINIVGRHFFMGSETGKILITFLRSGKYKISIGICNLI